MAPFISNNPTPSRLYKGPSAQMHTGEYRPYGMGKKGNVYIQNNYYGPQHPRGWAHNAWANMDHCCEDSGSKFGEVLGWVGVGMSAVGGILDLFGIGKKGSVEGDPGKSAKEKAKEEPTKTGNEDKAQGKGESTKTGNEDKAQGKGESTKTASDNKAQGKEESAKTANDNKAQTPVADEEGQEEDPGKAPTWNDQKALIYDTSGRTKKIEGKLKVTKEAKANSKFPEEFQTTTDSGYTYKYENTGRTDANNQPIYKCVSETVNGKTRNITSGNEYACQLDSNGNPKFQFEQNEQVGKDGLGKGV
ncbi:MAG: hypothetical protein VZR09_06985 [Candidatus Gastranaerophilaceae bacterium]|nr:hypothetical protein [Candidatus Gastranaerophilaceae bacterium]